jgi:spore coat polysaccharide biosynthesis protein SpsF
MRGAKYIARDATQLGAYSVKIVCTIEARMRSTRLPGKVMLPIFDRPMLELMIERLQRVSQLDGIVVATTIDSSCDPIVDLALRLGVGCYRGSEDDVLDRVLQAARSEGADLIVETTGDCPVIDPQTVSKVIGTFLNNDVDYCSNILERTYPRGMDVQVFPVTVLEEVDRLTKEPPDREHVSLYIYEHPERFSLLNIESGLPERHRDLRLTVDTPEDFRLIGEIYQELYPGKPDFGLHDICNLFDRRPELFEVNKNMSQKSAR